MKAAEGPLALHPGFRIDVAKLSSSILPAAGHEALAFYVVADALQNARATRAVVCFSGILARSGLGLGRQCDKFLPVHSTNFQQHSRWNTWVRSL